MNSKLNNFGGKYGCVSGASFFFFIVSITDLKNRGNSAQHFENDGVYYGCGYAGHQPVDSIQCVTEDTAVKLFKIYQHFKI